LISYIDIPYRYPDDVLSPWQKEELERVQKACRATVEGMDEEVALYREMVQEMRGGNK